jgi:hypothetical protein
MDENNVGTPSLEEIRRQRFIRWQAAQIEQLTTVNRLLIGLATGALGALLAVAREAATKTPDQGAVIVVLVFAGFVTLVSLASGLVLAVNRYESFRITALVTRKKQKKPEADKRTREERSEIASLECQYKRKDRLSRCLFCLQVWTFAFGALLLVGGEILDVCGRAR